MTQKTEIQYADEKGDLSALLAGLQSTSTEEVLFFPLYGQDAGTECYASVLRLNGQNVLLDCGWNEACDIALLAPLAVAAPYIDVVVLSHADIAHTGALPYAVARLGLKNNHIYCTLPVQHLGHLALYELLASRHDISDFEEFSYDDIDVAFEAIQGVRFGQQVNISAGLASHNGSINPSSAEAAESAAAPHTLQITAFAAGHSLGGAVWQMSLVDQDFVYAVSVNLKADLHLKGCSIHSEQHRPALLVTDCSDRRDPPSDQGDNFCRTVLTALKQKGGHVLVPVDTSARVLELLLLLNRYWAQHNLTFPIVLLARTALSTLMKARAQLEFLSESIQSKFTRGRGGNPFELPHVHATSNVEALSTIPNNGRLVVLAPLSSLDSGPARILFLDCGWASNPDNTVILPFGGGKRGSMAARLAHYAATTIQSVSPLVLEVDVARRVPLTQEELEERKAQEDAAVKLREEAAAQDEEMKDVDPLEEGGSPEEGGGVSDGEAGGGIGDLAAARDNTAAIAQQVVGGGHTHAAEHEGGVVEGEGAFAGVLIDGFRVPEGARAPMFPDPEPVPDWDEFGGVTDLAATFGKVHHDDDGAGSDMEAAAEDLVHGAVELPTLNLSSSKVIHERGTLQVRAHIMVFDFRSLISQSSFLSMVKHIAPRNLVLLRRPLAPPAGPGGVTAVAPLLAAVQRSLRGGFSCIHTPNSGEQVKMASIAAYAASMTRKLSQFVEEQPKTQRGVYRLGWLDSVAKERDRRTGALVLDRPPDEQKDDHTRAGVMLGNMMVSDITQRLRDQNIPVEQDGEVAVVRKKVGDSEEVAVVVYQRDHESRNKLVVEGALGEMYYQVREQVYQHCRLVPN